MLTKLVGPVLGLQAFLEVTVEDDEALDLGEMDIRVHAGVLLDGLGDAKFLARHHEVLQGRPEVAKGGRAATMKHAYDSTLCRRAVVATMDLAAANQDLLRTHHWLSSEDNVLVLRLTAPAWQEG